MKVDMWPHATETSACKCLKEKNREVKSITKKVSVTPLIISLSKKQSVHLKASVQ